MPKNYSSSESSRSRSLSRSLSPSVGNDDNEFARTVFVNGLEYEVTETDIATFFKKCGVIERINLPKYQNSTRNIGYCHVRFATRDEAKKALSMSGKYLGDRYVRIEMAKEMGLPSKGIFYGYYFQKDKVNQKVSQTQTQSL